MHEEKRTSPCLYIALGCLLAVILAVGACGGLVWFGVHQMKQVGEDMRDPEVRRQRVLGILGAEEPPEGYYPAIALSIPFLLDVAILTDVEPEAGTGPDIGQRGFLFFRARATGRQRRELEELITTRSEDAEILKRQSFRVRSRELIGHGEIDLDGTPVLYRSDRGAFENNREMREGILAQILVQCSGDSRVRYGLWFAPDPDPDRPVDALDLTGTPADEEALAVFLGHFDLCRG